MTQQDLGAALASFTTGDLAILWLKIMATGISFTLFIFVAVFAVAAVVQRDRYAGLAWQFMLANLFAVLYIASDAVVRFDVLTGNLDNTLLWYRLALSAVYLSLAAYISLYWSIDARHGRRWLRPGLWVLAVGAVGIVWLEHPALIIASDHLTVRDMSVFADYGAAAPWFFAVGLLLFLGFCIGIARVLFRRVGGVGRVLNLAGFGLLLGAGLHDALRELRIFLFPFSTLGLGYMGFQMGAFAFFGLHYGRTLRDRHRQDREIRQLAEAVARDNLSGLFARRHLEQRLDEMTDPAGGLLFIDLDDFKAINDRYGHNAGDAVITAVGEALRHGLRADDLACRWGGDEFLVYVSAADDGDLRTLLERLRERIGGIRVSVAPALRVGVSMGYANIRGETWRNCLERADDALYAAKQAGKGRLSMAWPDTAPDLRPISNTSI